jgi:acyl-coenzyme A synthetase/AMP-(fatty) acid ligase
MLLQHPKVVDAAVIGVYSEEEVTELPRFVSPVL